MATKILYALSLLTACAVMITPLTQSTNHITPQVVHQKLEDALLADRTILYLMKKVFFPLQGLPPNLVEISVCVTVGSGLPENCDENSSFSGTSNFSYWQSFQWSSSALVFLISFDQLIILDNVISIFVYRLNISPHYHLPIQLHIDSLPADISEDDLVEGLIQLLTWVSSACAVCLHVQYLCNRGSVCLSLNFVSQDKCMSILLAASYRNKEKLYSHCLNCYVSLSLTCVIVQAKSYANVRRQADVDDRGYVSIRLDLFSTRLHAENKNAHLCRVALLCAFVFLNILMPIALAKSLSWYYPRVRVRDSTRDVTTCLYWAAALIAFLMNIIYTGISIINHSHNHPAITACITELPKHKCLFPSDTRLYKDEVLTLIAKTTIIPIAVFIELIVSIHTVRHHIIGRRYGSRSRFWKCCLLQTIHAFALWNILITIQLSTMFAIPLCVLLLTHPQVTFLCLVLLVIIPVGFTLTVAYLLYQCHGPRRRRVCCNARHCGSMFVHLTVIISAIGLTVMLLALYELMLISQVQIETGITGIVLSLLPSLPLSALGWYVKRRSQRAVMNDGDETSHLSAEQHAITQSRDNEDEDPLPL